MATQNRTDSPIEIQLTKGYTTVIDACDADLAELKWSALVIDTRVYAQRCKRVDGRDKRFYLHRVIMERKLGRPLTRKEMVDHADNDGLNNRRDNLRIATPQQNSWNQALTRRNTTGYKGVQRLKRNGKYLASIIVNRKTILLGTYDDPQEAHAAYCEAAKRICGEFARFE